MAFKGGRRGGEGAGGNAGFGRERKVHGLVVGVTVLLHFEGCARHEPGREERGGRSLHHLVGDADGDRLRFGGLVETDAELGFTGGIVGNIEFDAVVLARFGIGNSGRLESRLDAVLFFQIGLNGNLTGLYIGGPSLVFLELDIATFGCMHRSGVVGKIFLEGIGIFDRNLYVGQRTLNLDGRIFAVAHRHIALSQIIRLVESLLFQVAVIGTHGVGTYGNFFGGVEVGQTVPRAGETAVGRNQFQGKLVHVGRLCRGGSIGDFGGRGARNRLYPIIGRNLYIDSPITRIDLLVLICAGY